MERLKLALEDLDEAIFALEDKVSFDAANRREGFDEDLKRRPQLILGGALDGGIGEFGFGADAEGRDRVGKGGGFRQGLIPEVT